MGYYTSYELTWNSQPPRRNPEFQRLVDSVGDDQAEKLVEAGIVKMEKSIPFSQDIAEWIAGNEEAAYALRSDGSRKNETKWYNHETDLLSLSVFFPDVLFTLRGEGEESGDLWVKYFLGGKVEESRTQITFAPCTLRKSAP